MTLYGLLTFCAVYALTGASPGPGIAAVIARGLAHGMKGTPAFIAGFLAGDLVWFGIAATGLAALGKQPAARAALAEPAPAQQGRLGAAQLLARFGAVGAGLEQRAAAVVAQRQRGGVGPGAAIRRAQAPAGVGDRARGEGRERQVQHVGALEEKRPLLRHR